MSKILNLINNSQITLKMTTDNILVFCSEIIVLPKTPKLPLKLFNGEFVENRSSTKSAH